MIRQLKAEYFQRLFDVSAKADWAGWVRFCLQGAISQAKDTITRCRTLLTLREGYRQRLTQSGEGSVRLVSIVEGIFESPFVRVADLQRRLGVTYPTANKDVARLESAGILKELPNVYPKTYYAPEVFQVAYEKLED